MCNADLVKNADLMWKQSVWTSVIASSVSAHHLKEGGMLVLTGAQSALKATAGMVTLFTVKLCNVLLAIKIGLPVKVGFFYRNIRYL